MNGMLSPYFELLRLEREGGIWGHVTYSTCVGDYHVSPELCPQNSQNSGLENSLWDEWKNPDAPGETVRSATMIVGDVNGFVGRVHDLMPVLLAKDDVAAGSRTRRASSC